MCSLHMPKYRAAGKQITWSLTMTMVKVLRWSQGTQYSRLCMRIQRKWADFWTCSQTINHNKKESSKRDHHLEDLTLKDLHLRKVKVTCWWFNFCNVLLSLWWDLWYSCGTCDYRRSLTKMGEFHSCTVHAHFSFSSPKTKILSSDTHPCVIPSMYDFLFSVEHSRRYFVKCLFCGESIQWKSVRSNRCCFGCHWLLLNKNSWNIYQNSFKKTDSKIHFVQDLDLIVANWQENIYLVNHLFLTEMSSCVLLTQFRLTFKDIKEI